MTLNLSMPEITELKPKILVVGVGGAGGNAVNNMIKADLQGVEFIVANTDAQALANSTCERRIQLGHDITQGLGAGARPDVGAAAAQEALEEIKEELQGAHMAFITAGMGGGTGTGAAPVIAQVARDLGLLTVGVVTKPFQFEGSRRMTIADQGTEELQKYVDTLIIIPNQNLFRVANEKTTFADAFGMADNVLHSGVRGITDLMVMPGLINLDFADVRTVMMEMGKAMMGTGAGEGESRAIEAAEAAISNPLLDEISMKGAKGVLINITGGDDLTLFEVDEAANRIRSEVDPEANIIVGSTFDENLNGTMRVSVFATGIDADPALARDSSGYSEMPRRAPQSTPEPEIPAAVAAAGESPSPEKRPSLFVFEDENDHKADSPTTVEEPAPEVVRTEESRPAPQPALAQTLQSRVKIDDTEETYGGNDEGLLAEEKVNRLRTKIEELAKVQDPYIAPEPMEVEADDGEFETPAAAKPDPFADAAMRNGSHREERKGPSLVERLTGRSRPRSPEAPSQATGSASEEEPLTLRQVHPGDRTETRPEAQPTAAEVVSDQQAEGRVRRPMTADQIDIPAFLRRQAN